MTTQPTTHRFSQGVRSISVLSFLVLISSCSKAPAPQPAPDNPPSVAVVSPAQAQVAELQAKVKKREENRARLTKLIASMQADRLGLLKRIDVLTEQFKQLLKQDYPSSAAVVGNVLCLRTNPDAFGNDAPVTLECIWAV